MTGYSSSNEQSNDEGLSLKEAGRWVSLLDEAKWELSWQAAGAIFRAQLTVEDWTKMISGVRDNLGLVLSRSHIGTRRISDLKSVPKLEHIELQFQTEFNNKAEALETIVLTSEDGRWNVNGYFIR